MKNFYLSIVSVFFIGLLTSNCSSDDKTVDIVISGITKGSYLRTLSFAQADLDITNLSSTFNVVLEQQDEEDGNLLDYVAVSARFVDNTLEGTDHSSNEFFVTNYNRDAFEIGPLDLPRLSINLSLSQLLEATGISQSQISCKDQFIVQLEVFLTDGRSFTVGSGEPCVVAFETFFSSPYRYLVNLVVPMDPDLFTGTYVAQTVKPLDQGENVSDIGLVSITKGEDLNTRILRFSLDSDAAYYVRARKYRFSLACDESVFWENQLEKRTANCVMIGTDVLLGPDVQNAPISPLEDSVFELWFVTGYLGFDGGTGVGPQSQRLRFTKQ